MLLAAIDIGSNAVRLLFANVYEQNGRIMAEKASLVRVPVRLGADVFSTQKISPEKTTELIKTMNAFRLLIEVFRPKGFKAFATAAMREAENGKEIILKIKRETGIQIKLIDGFEEARIVSSVQNEELYKRVRLSMFIDVGGGSTEISVISSKGIENTVSFKIGTVRLLNEKVESGEWQRLEDWLLPYAKNNKDLVCVGSGGNVNKLAKLYGKVPDKLLPFNNLEYAIGHLERFSLKERIELMGLRPDRADVIVPAAKIFHFIMKNLEAQELYVPKIGLSDGMVSMLYREMCKK